MLISFHALSTRLLLAYSFAILSHINALLSHCVNTLRLVPAQQEISILSCNFKRLLVRFLPLETEEQDQHSMRRKKYVKEKDFIAAMTSILSQSTAQSAQSHQHSLRETSKKQNLIMRSLAEPPDLDVTSKQATSTSVQAPL